MAIRFAAASGLAVAMALIAATPARAQNFFDFFEMSPRQIVGILADDGYQLRGPMTRRGDVYICNAVSVSGRSMRLIVSARDGRVLERTAIDERRRFADDDNGWGWHSAPRPPRDVSEDQDRQQGNPRDQYAFGDNPTSPQPRTYGNDFFFGSKPATPTATPDENAEPSKPKHHAIKKHHEPAVAKAPASGPAASPDANAPTPSPSVATVAPSAPSTPTPEAVKPVTSAPTPAPSIAAVAPSAPATPAKAAVEPVKPAATTEPAKATEKPERSVSADTEKAPAAPKPKTETSRKKINDLPVGTLD